ncbi:hypothetical protein QF025_004480 [Paraburkholderia graminis]|uniref:Uncharacterized protein n=1 Tax=Paraburkholderia graminis TaxID=60548 RepID=A0ABD5CMJ8_9BURK|nr:hypothetical protein [Paraburkholderia graminis]
MHIVRCAKRCAQVLRRVVEAVNIRAHQANIVLARNRHDFLLAFHVAGFRKAGRNQHRARNVLLADFRQRAGDELRGNRKHSDVDIPRHVQHTLIGLVAHDLVGLRVDRIDLALVATVDQVLHHRVADLAVFRRCTDHRDRIRLHDAVHLPHDVFLTRPIALYRRGEIEHDAHVGGNRTALAREHGVQIQLGDFGEVGHEPRDVFDQPGERLAVDGFAAAHALEHVGSRDAVEH